MSTNKIYESLCSSKLYCSIDTVDVMQIVYYVQNQTEKQEIEDVYEISYDCVSLKAKNEKQEDVLIKIKNKNQHKNYENTILSDQINELDEKKNQKQIEYKDFIIQIFQSQHYLSPQSLTLDELSTAKHISVTELQINNKYMNLDQNRLEQIEQNLNQCQNLLSLNLNVGSNFLDESKADQIGETISKAKNLVNLVLDFSFNKLGVSGSEKLCNQISNCKNLKILQLNLSNNFLTNHGLESLATGLNYFKNLTFLSLNLESNMINQNGTVLFSQAIANCQDLNQLNLQFSTNQLGKTGFENIFCAVCQCTKLEKLELSFQACQIGNQFSKLKQQAQQLQKLKYLDLDLESNDLNSKGIRIILEEIGSLQNLNYLRLNINENKYPDNEVGAIKQNLSKLVQLESLILLVGGNNNYSDNIYADSDEEDKEYSLILFNDIVDSISNLSKLKCLHIDLNICLDINYVNIKYLKEIAQNLRSLKKLYWSYDEYKQDIIQNLKKIRRNLRIVQSKIVVN